ncbi:unnamed protein product [Pichia kudriavzevii]
MISYLKSPGKFISLEWLYSASFAILMFFILSMTSTMPVDVIVQSKTTNTHLATNTVIILVICVVFIAFAAVLHLFRLLFNKLLLQEIPKPYIPITEKDIGKHASRMIEKEMDRCMQIKEMAMPKGNIEHPGLYHPSEYDNSDNVYELPNDLIYENVIQIIGQEIKYNGTLTLSNSKILRLDNHYSLREHLQFYQSDPKIKRFLDSYEELRFSGKPIYLKDFEEFLQNWSYVKKTI